MVVGLVEFLLDHGERSGRQENLRVLSPRDDRIP
jgi:hypothetical protein